MNFLFPPHDQPHLPIADSEQVFPIRRVFCIGKNYSEHVREMGGDPTREEPLFFTKPADAVIGPGVEVRYPPGTTDLHFEVELVVALGADLAAQAAVGEVLESVIAYGVGIDLTRRDLQAAAKQRGRPWDMAKAFDASALCSALSLVDKIGHPVQAEISLQLDGREQQRDNIENMVWSPSEILVELSRLVQLRKGDLIYTGTPSGVGAVERGQTMAVSVAGVGQAVWTLS